MSGELKLDSIIQGSKMSISEKLAAKKKADEEKELYDKAEIEKRLDKYHEEQTGMRVPEGPSVVVDHFVEHMKDKSEEKVYQADPDVIATHALDMYRSYKGEKDSVDRFVGLLEEGRILLPYGIIDDEDLANAILIKVVEISNEPTRETSSVFAPENIKLENEELHLGDAYEQKVHEAIEKHADSLLADSVTMFAEAMNFDPRFCDIIVRGDTQFYNQIEEMGYPMLSLMVKGLMNGRTDKI